MELTEVKDERSVREVIAELDRCKKRIAELSVPKDAPISLFSAVDAYSLIGIAERLLRGI